MAKKWGTIVPEESEVFLIEVNDEHPFARGNISGLLHSLNRCEETKKECSDGALRDFFVLDPDGFQGLLKNPKFLEHQYVLWHTTKKTILPVRYLFEKETLDEVKASKSITTGSALATKQRRGRRSK